MSLEPEGRHALVIATARYEDPKLQQLRGPAADADRLAKVLRDPAKGNFDVEVLTDESHSKVTRRIASFFRDRRPGDLLLLHFSCHGVKDDRGDLYLAASDTELDLLSATGVSAAWLNEQINRTRSRRTVVLLDCCFSGSFPFGMRSKAGGNVNAPEQFEGRGRAIITASSGMEYAYEGDHLKGDGQPSVFTEAVLEGLETGEADLDHDQLVSVDDLYSYVYDRVRETTPSQTPNKKSEIEGPLYLARSTYRPPAQLGILDPELLARTEDRYPGIRAGAVQELAQLLGSRDVAMALAAREALSRMIKDDSRQVSASAEIALARAEETEPARPNTTRGEREPGQRGQTQSGGGNIDGTRVEVGTDDDAKTGDASIEPILTPGAGAARERRVRLNWPRRHPRLTVAAALAAVAAAAAIIGVSGGPSHQRPASSSHSQYQTLLNLLPATIRSSCSNKEHWMIAPDEARAQATCPGANYDLTYGLWPSPSKAQQWVGTARDPGSIPCSTSTTNAMKDKLPNATTGCQDKVHGQKGIDLWWNEDGSPVAASFSWSDRNQAAALRQWQQLVKAQ